jgi:hypothetical protein
MGGQCRTEDIDAQPPVYAAQRPVSVAEGDPASHAPLGVFEFQLVRDGFLVTADRATTVNAPVALDAFLMQLCPL